MTRTPIANLKGPTGATGPQGLPGVNGVANDAAMAALVGLPSATRDALEASFATVTTLTGSGIDLTGVADSTSALAALFATATDGSVFVGVEGATYKVAMVEGAALATFTGLKNVTVDMSRSKIANPTSYTTDALTSVFVGDATDGLTVKVGEYEGYVLPAPGTHLGYLGATLLRVINGATRTTLHADAHNLRYGLQSGQYNDGSKGECAGFDVRMTGTMIGYPVALYNADDVRLDLDVDGVHRLTYLAGVHGVRGTGRFRDQYIAPIVHFMTDALVSGSDAAAEIDPVGDATVSRGCADIDFTIIDKGSTVFDPASVLAGIALSRVDPCEFRDIRTRVHVVGSDTLSTRMGGFRITSVGMPHARYPFAWESHVVFDNIVVSGTIDHSAQTLTSNATGEVYIGTEDGTNTAHHATVRNLVFEDLVILRSPASTRDVFLLTPGLTGSATFNRVNATGSQLLLSGATPTGPGATVELVESRFAGIQNYSTQVVSIGLGCVIGPVLGGTPFRAVGLGAAGGGAVQMQKEVTLTLSGATTTWSNAIPGGALLLGVQGKISATIPGPTTGYTVGITGDTARFANRNDLASGVGFTPSAQAGTEVSPKWYLGTTSIVVTAKTSNFTGGTLRLVITYMSFPSLV